jgi:hypothetical protein
METDRIAKLDPIESAEFWNPDVGCSLLIWSLWNVWACTPELSIVLTKNILLLQYNGAICINEWTTNALLSNISSFFPTSVSTQEVRYIISCSRAGHVHVSTYIRLLPPSRRCRCCSNSSDVSEMTHNIVGDYLKTKTKWLGNSAKRRMWSILVLSAGPTRCTTQE